LRDAIEAKLAYVLGKRRETAKAHDWYQATVLAVRDPVVDIWLRSRAGTKRLHKKRVYYLSIEFLIGRLLVDTLRNLQLFEPVRRALANMGVELDELCRIEPDAALGNGGFGRLAAIDSMSALGIPAYSYGIRYETGCSSSASATAGNKKFPKTGSPWAIPGSSRGPTAPIPSASAVWSNILAAMRPRHAPSGTRRRPCWRCPMTPRSPVGAGGT
jgi:glycogen phosphorylase